MRTPRSLWIRPLEHLERIYKSQLRIIGELLHGRRTDIWALARDWNIGNYVALLETNGPKKAALARAMKVYGVSRATVFAAKKKKKERDQLRDPLTGELWQPEPDTRTAKEFEREAAEIFHR